MNQEYLQAALVWAKREDLLHEQVVMALEQFQYWLYNTSIIFDISQEKLINLLAAIKL